MKKLAAILIIVLGILLVLAFTVPSKKDYEEFITTELKNRTHDDLLGLNDFMIDNLAKLVFIGAEYKDVKVGSTYAFSLGKDNTYKFVGFGTLIICVEGDLTILEGK
jgi:hypothetical protein